LVYFYAAYIAKCYLNEPNAETIRKFAYDADGLASCEIARVEFYSVVAQAPSRREHQFNRIAGSLEGF